MDYTKIPRELIYKDRTNLKDYGVQVYGTMNNYLFTQMRKLTLLRCGNAKEIALQCFNNAYYICTLIQLDEYPDLSMDKYEKNLLEVKIPFPEDVYQASMALVCVLLAAYDDKYKQNDNPLIDSIHHWTSSNKWTGSLCHNSFEDILKACSTDKFTLPKSEFAPRNIIEIIENCSESDLQVYPEFICERLALLKDPRQQMHGADMAIARIKDFQHELCEESEYNPQKNCFNRTIDIFSISDLNWEISVRNKYQQSKEAIDYYTEHYPTNEETVESSQTPETDNLQTKIDELESKLTYQEIQMGKANNINTQQAKRIKELEAEVLPIKDLESDLEELRKWKQLSRGQVALFCHALAEYCKFAQKTKQDDIAPMAHKLFGIGYKSAYNLMVSGYSKKDREHVAKIFDTIWPQFAEFIMNTFDKKSRS